MTADFDREKIATRIRALAAKTVENGCTENEAIAAAAKLAEMLAAYNMTLDEAMLREQPFAGHQERRQDGVGDRLWKPAAAIAKLTGARYWRSRAGIHPVTIDFFGFEHEVLVAKYMLAICARAMEDGQQRTLREFALLSRIRQRMRVDAFLDGMADTLHRRIMELIPPKVAGTGLMVLHGALVDAEMAARGIELEKARSRSSRDFDQGYLDGALAAERVRLDRGIGAPEKTRGLLR